MGTAARMAAAGGVGQPRDRVPVRRVCGGRLVTRLAISAGLLGCAVLRPVPLDVPPGQHAVLGRLDLSGLGVPEGTIEIVREDRTFEDAIHVGPGQRDFAVSLPPGRYLVWRLRAFRDQRRFANVSIWDLQLAFDVGSDAAVYIGTLRVVRLGERVRVDVLDEYDDTLRVLRRQHPDLPATIPRSLLRPGS